MTRPPALCPAVLLAAVLVIAGCNAGSPSESERSGPSLAADASVAESPSAAASQAIDLCPEGRVAGGTYRISAHQTMTVAATITIADGWDGCGLLLKDWGEVGGPSLIGFWQVENVYADPCHWVGGLMDPVVGMTAADLTAALADQELTEATDPSTATLGGRPASYLRLTVPEDADVSDCDRVNGPEFRFFKGPGEELTGSAVWWLGAEEAPGLIGEVWATDVDGVRVVVNAAYFSDATQAEVDEVHGIVASIAFDE